MRRPLTIPTLLVALLALAATGAACRRTNDAPPPRGTRVLSGIVTSFDVSDDGNVVIAEMRVRLTKAGEAREQVAVARGPAWDAPPEGLGRGAMLPQVSPDGRHLVWLASKERSSRTGPGRLRATAGGTVHDLRHVLPPFVFEKGRVLWLGSFNPVFARGTLASFDLERGGPATNLLADVPPDGFAPLAGGVFALQKPRSGGCRAFFLAGTAKAQIADGLDCEDPQPAFAVSPTRGEVWLRAAPDGAGRRALLRWSAAAGTTTAAANVDAIAIDADGTAWWASEENGAVSVHRDGAPPGSVEGTFAGTFAGRFVRSVHPVPGGGAWVALADRRCAGDRAASPSPACLRIASAGAPAPPAIESVVRRVEGRPWPLVAFVGDTTPPEVLAVFDPLRPVTVSGPAVGLAVSDGGRRLAIRRALAGGESVALVDLATGKEEVLATGAPDPGDVAFHGERLYYVWKLRRNLNDPRSGLYLFDPEAAAGGAPRALQ